MLEVVYCLPEPDHVHEYIHNQQAGRYFLYEYTYSNIIENIYSEQYIHSFLGHDLYQILTMGLN